VVVNSNSSSPVRVGYLAEVRLGPLTRYGVVTQDGKGEAVQGLVLGLAGANARQVVAGVQLKLKELEATLPK
ncbi:efflux RND transporter permease subunit, partial [Escherichia coli]|nr:efflux RND transporter permease subunit [Escherichia coli]